MSQGSFRRVAWATLVVTLGVILWGAFVRATGAGAGCGSHWPTCNGEVLPRAPSVKTLIEFTHRLTSGIAFLLTLLQLVWAFRAFPRRHAVRFGAVASMFFMVTEAAVGAGIVLFERVAGDTSIARGYWMSAHLINTFLLVAAMTLTVLWASGGPLPRRSSGTPTYVLGGGLLGVVAVGVTGAIAALGDTLFPAKTLSEGLAADVSQTAHVFVQLRVYHPIVASVVAAYLLFATGFVTSHRPALLKPARLVSALVIVQIGAGFLNLFLLAPVAMQLIHLLLADLVWMALVVLTAWSLADAPESTSSEPTGSSAALPWSRLTDEFARPKETPPR
ncbi:COX15/CtaA family protein [Polyangium sorediatum]|uniref:COX15/CtaA family protein n=1 Tax=Polyangium sorediatum TaxID=889274 RepID=A0ABT6PAG0_9BACT|nr:COX15/CtaA family protein [Polyangium sorediatum]MDI1437523.1 COX15/CtaA family protein [Polyangium sorediatum]